MAENKKLGVPRVVRSGRVYKQMFDAEVQLNKALDESKQRQEEKVREAQKPNPMHRPEGIPVVKAKETTAGGMLTDRQQIWIEGFPNEPYLENPVVYKQYSEAVQSHQREPQASTASKEVRGLPDVITPVKTGSDIIERIADSRKQRHEAAVEDLHQELGLISSELEPRIVESGELLMGRLADDDSEIDNIMARIQNDEDLILYTQRDLADLWQEVASHSVTRQHWIAELDSALSKVETDRMDLVRDVFGSYAKNLEKIAHLMKPDLQKMMDKESQMINQTVLSNRRAYADLYARMMMSDIEREKRLHTQWRKRVEDWKKLHVQKTVQQFKEFMESPSILAPPGAQNVTALMRKEQDILNQKRLELISSLRDMKPPMSTKSAVYQWNHQITELSKQIDSLNQDYFGRLCVEYEGVCQQCLEQVEAIRVDLIERGICTESTAKQVLDEHCLPLVGERQSGFEKHLEDMDKQLEAHNASVLKALKSLFKFCQGAAHVWDVHELGLARQERALQEKLDTCRHKHDNENQNREANLDIVMDRMRQDASEQALQNSLRKALDMLDQIKAGYDSFHEAQMDVVSSYPSMVQGETQRYDSAVCKFFSVGRTHPDDAPSSREDTGLNNQENQPAPTPSPRARKSGSKNSKRPSSRSSSAASEEQRTARSPLPQVVSEVLSTAKGSTFYVLTVAGEHGVTPEQETRNSPRDAQETAAEDGGTFLTEAPPIEEPDASEKPEFIQSVDVPDSLIMEVKKQIRMNYLDQLEDWSDQAIDRSHSVVAAKTEELNSELDLRLHLHEPRARRAELDIHNVRAAELVMHSERVMRHCKGINQALNDLKNRFNQMTQEHNQLADKFKQDIEALETIFINATKSSKLVALSNQLQEEQDRYMDKIRASLRQFRQHLDDVLQMLRESNARFMKSFKVFSDGGNFCPEEIEEFRKKLEKMAQKIDSAEGFILADLEGIESKRLDQASKTSTQFEDRFKHHMIDLLFMEKIARWLTNTQVKVKAEVADSNSQAKRLAQYLNDLDRRIDACERPNLDKEQVTPTQLNEGAKMIFEEYHNRSQYLNCAKEVEVIRPSSAIQGNIALGARVGFVAAALKSDSVIPISRAGKQPSEDPSVGVIKNIIKTQKDRQRFGVSVDLDSDLNPASQSQAAKDGPNSASADGRDKSSREKSSKDKRSKTGKSRASDNESRSKKGSKPGTAAGSVGAETPKRAQSGTQSRLSASRQSLLSGLSMHSLSWTSIVTAWNHRKPNAGRSKTNKIDRKYYVFGEAPEEGEDAHFLGKIKHILRETLDGLLSASEMYYRQKGNRVVTRPQALQETFDQCAEVLVQKLESYQTQAQEYHNQCLQELRGQLTRLEQLVAHIPSCVIKEQLQLAVQGARDERQHLDSEFNNQLTRWEQAKVDHKHQLRPTLGHPQQEGKLETLCEREDDRKEAYLRGVESHTGDLQESAVSQAHKFLDDLARTSESLLLQFDLLLTVDDVEKGRVPAAKHATTELIRRKNAGQPLVDDPDKDRLPRGANTWTGLPRNELVKGGEEEIQETPKQRRTGSRAQKSNTEEPSLTASVTTAKTTLGHSATVKARNLAYQEYKKQFEKELADIEDSRDKLQVAEERWTESWNTSVQRVKQLY